MSLVVYELKNPCHQMISTYHKVDTADGQEPILMNALMKRVDYVRAGQRDDKSQLYALQALDVKCLAAGRPLRVSVNSAAVVSRKNDLLLLVRAPSPADASSLVYAA